MKGVRDLIVRNLKFVFDIVEAAAVAYSNEACSSQDSGTPPSSVHQRADWINNTILVGH
jgi:hypothetical protein